MMREVLLAYGLNLSPLGVVADGTLRDLIWFREWKQSQSLSLRLPFNLVVLTKPRVTCVEERVQLAEDCVYGCRFWLSS